MILLTFHKSDDFTPKMHVKIENVTHPTYPTSLETEQRPKRNQNDSCWWCVRELQYDCFTDTAMIPAQLHCSYYSYCCGQGDQSKFDAGQLLLLLALLAIHRAEDGVAFCH